MTAAAAQTVTVGAVARDKARAARRPSDEAAAAINRVLYEASR